MKSMKVVLYSITALICVFLMFAVDWLFIIPAVILSALSQKELMKKTK